MCRFYAGSYGDDMGNPVNERLTLAEYKKTIQNHLESTDFEDAIRNAVSLGGDSDTLAAITGSIAEAAYGIPQWIQDKAWSYLDQPIRDLCQSWDAKFSA